ncbi:MAG TPA: WHG domain-containing protein [Thermoleophilia bacterium]|nr:WHG domain-containing protein [Thermoleophilia bacterium]
MPRAGLNRDAVIAHALEVLDASGANGLTLKAIADRAGVATPSLYKHIRSLTELRGLLAVRVLEEMALRSEAAVTGLEPGDAVEAFLAEYREFARSYPHRHALVETCVGADPDVECAAARLVGVLSTVVKGFGLDGAELIHAVRALRAAVAGFATLELGRGYRNGVFHDVPTVDGSFAFLARMLTTGLRSRAPRHSIAA